VSWELERPSVAPGFGSWEACPSITAVGRGGQPSGSRRGW
jgi:hypothetical protein